MTKIAKGARMTSFARKQIIFNPTIELAKTKGYRNITRKDIAEFSSSAQGLISHYFGTISNLRREVLKEAIDKEIMPILVDTLSENILSHDLKQKVIHYLT